MKAKAMRIGMTINKALSMSVKKTIRAAPGNNINHPSRQMPNDQGHNPLKALWIFKGSLAQVFSEEFLLSAIRTAMIPRIGGPKPAPVRSIRVRRANKTIWVFLSRPGFINATRNTHEKKIARSPVIK